MNLYVDENTRDIAFEADGSIATITGAADIAQAVRCTLQAWLGKWELDVSHGTDYEMAFSDIAVSDAEIKEIISAAIYQEPQVKKIEMLEIERVGRVIHVCFAARLKSGEMISGEVDNNG